MSGDFDYPILLRSFNDMRGIMPSAGEPREIVDIVAPEGYSLDRCDNLERAFNLRERNLHNNTHRTYRVYPFGTILPSQQVTAGENFKAVITCTYCGQWGARGCACRHCGAPIG